VTRTDHYHAVVEAIQAMLVDETESLVQSNAAVLELEEGGVGLRPRRPSACAVTIYVQNDAEVSLFPTAPGTDRRRSWTCSTRIRRRSSRRFGSTSERFSRAESF
jgi:hypothetical protein